ncbi:GSK3B-interacting protein isoform X1 [Anolis sagrei]|uniref:GSK3B-interacting protein isoform X1 n=2 Tax=Anolis sagrei TaxID=38937 RepID=UPI003522FF64
MNHVTGASGRREKRAEEAPRLQSPWTEPEGRRLFLSCLFGSGREAINTRWPGKGCTGVMETDYNPMDLSNSTGIEDHSEFKEFEGTDVKDMRLEAEAVVNDVLFAVGNMFVSKSLPCAEDVAYINVETRERNRYCLELTEAGLRVVGYAFDQVDDSVQNPYHETVYSLLDSVSPAYREAFGNALLQRLEALKRDGQS